MNIREKIKIGGVADIVTVIVIVGLVIALIIATILPMVDDTSWTGKDIEGNVSNIGGYIQDLGDGKNPDALEWYIFAYD